MAMCDYYLCDRCGEKCFYDANCYEQLERAGDIVAICKDCARTHECVVVEKPGSEGEK